MVPTCPTSSADRWQSPKSRNDGRYPVSASASRLVGGREGVHRLTNMSKPELITWFESVAQPSTLQLHRP